MITNIIKYTEPVGASEKYAIEVVYNNYDAQLLEFNTQAEQLEKYASLRKEAGEQ